MATEFTRRNFLTGAGMMAASAAAMGLVACAEPKVAVGEGDTTTAASDAAETTSAAAGTTIGFDGSDVMPWLKAEPEIADSDVTEELDCDVVVVGLGDAGVPAVRAAVEAGASVVAIERCNRMTCTGSDMAIIGGKTMETWGRGDGYMDKDMLVERHMDECSHHSNYGIVERWVDEVGEVFDWFVEGTPSLYIAPESYADIPEANQGHYLHPYFYPMPETYNWEDEVMPCYPTSVGFSNLAQAMSDNLQIAVDAGADVRLSTKAEKLITEGGAVRGVYARDLENGGYLKINAKAVVLATGDYNSNEEMLRYYQPEVYENGNMVLAMNTDAEGNPANDGSGHALGVYAGAKIEQWHAPMIHHMGGGAGPDGRGVMGNNGYLWLNLDGKRFMNEDLAGQQLENQVELQRERRCYQFFDSAWPTQLDKFPAAHGIAFFYRDEQLPAWTASGERINVRCPEDLQAALDDGRAFQADTIEELLAKLNGIDVETAKESIEHYNEVCKSGKDTDFGKKSTRLFALENPPYYAAECGCALTLANLGGIESDRDAHAYDTNRNIIDGLYVAGGVQGGRFNVQYPISLKGASISMCLFYGYIAGTNAAQGI